MQFSEIVPVLQISISPVILISGVGLLLVNWSLAALDLDLQDVEKRM